MTCIDNQTTSEKEFKIKFHVFKKSNNFSTNNNSYQLQKQNIFKSLFSRALTFTLCISSMKQKKMSCLSRSLSG